MRRLPSREEIYRKAREQYHKRTRHLPAITPSRAELRETGEFHRARIQLMRSDPYAGAYEQYEAQTKALAFETLRRNGGPFRGRPLRGITRRRQLGNGNGLSRFIRREKKVVVKRKAKPKRKPRRKKLGKINAGRNGRRSRKYPGKGPFTIPASGWKGLKKIGKW